MPTSTSASPRIYYLYPQLIDTSSERDDHLVRCATMGFTHVMIPIAPLMKADGNKYNGGERADSPIAQSIEALRELAQACAARSLCLILDIDFDSIGIDLLPGGTPPEHDCEEQLPDPRQRSGDREQPVARLVTEVAVDTVLAHWQPQLRGWIAAGVGGFCCGGVASLSPRFWAQLVGDVKSMNNAVSFLAWTPGCTAEQLSSLAGVGFDATFSSAAWWDYHAPWLAEEHIRLASVAPPLAFPDDPHGSLMRRFGETGDDDANERACRRALALAATLGTGMLVPMGFEYGLGGRLDLREVDAARYAKARLEAPFDLTQDIAQANALNAHASSLFPDAAHAHMRSLTMPESAVAALLRFPLGNENASSDAQLLLINADVHRASTIDLQQICSRTRGFTGLERVWPDGTTDSDVGQAITLEPAAVQVIRARRMPPIVNTINRGKRAIETAARVPRIAIEAVAPAVDGGAFPAKRIVGETVRVTADVLIDGHDKLGVVLLWRTVDETTWHEIAMVLEGNDRWAADLPLMRVGRHLFTIEAWRDAFLTYRDELGKKAKAGLDVSLELEEGRLMVVAAAQRAVEHDRENVAATLNALLTVLGNGKKPRAGKPIADQTVRVEALLSDATLQAMRQADARVFAVRHDPALSIDAERTAAGFSSWYELFPRSQSGDPSRHGTFGDVIKRLPAIRDMGFDTLYFTPIHPIGKRNRKGRNNSLTPSETDPGSPYAIGAAEGGHDAIHPELGSLDDFRRLRREAQRHGLELALDFAIQCSPDHPWLKQHPEWFAWRPDGSIRYAENPPKKYEDIVNVDFYAEGAVPGLWAALRDAVLFWVKEGVRVFRVDNPHTKPLPFWQWMIGDIRSRYPDTIFLSEAFTRPKMMYRLAKVGFSQSYTYFTWRDTKAEFIEYLTELTTTPVRDYFRPHFFVNTPDINPVFLQRSGRPGFLIRAALATTLSGLWGMYSGFELCEATPVPGKEEYFNSEKYEIRAWDWNRPGNIIAEITALNRIRLTNPALQTHLNVQFCPSSDDNILYFIKATPHPTDADRFGDNVVLVAINLDPFAAHETSLELPLWRFGLPDDGTLEVDDLLKGNRFMLQGKYQHLRLDAFEMPYAVWRLRPAGRLA